MTQFRCNIVKNKSELKFALNLFVGTLNQSFFGLSETDELDTYFFRLRAVDDAGNFAAWSNEISASFVNPADYEVPVCI